MSDSSRRTVKIGATLATAALAVGIGVKTLLMPEKSSPPASTPDVEEAIDDTLMPDIDERYINVSPQESSTESHDQFPQLPEESDYEEAVQTPEKPAPNKVAYETTQDAQLALCRKENFLDIIENQQDILEIIADIGAGLLDISHMDPDTLHKITQENDHNIGVFFVEEGGGTVAYRMELADEDHIIQHYAGHTAEYPEEKVVYNSIMLTKEEHPEYYQSDLLEVLESHRKDPFAYKNAEAERYEILTAAVREQMAQIDADLYEKNSIPLTHAECIEREREREAELRPSSEEIAAALEEDIAINTIVFSIATGEYNIENLSHEELDNIRNYLSEEHSLGRDTHAFPNYGVDISITQEGEISATRRIVDFDSEGNLGVLLFDTLFKAVRYARTKCNSEV